MPQCSSGLRTSDKRVRPVIKVAMGGAEGGGAMSDLPTIVKLRYDLERWVNGRGGKIINKTVNVIDRNAEIVFEDATTGATFRVDIKELSHDKKRSL